MARPYSKRTVEDAALLCDVIASSQIRVDEYTVATFGPSFEEVARDLEIAPHTTAYRLADAALDATCEYESNDGCGVEAAALIRSGWMIGDPVELLALPVETETIATDTVCIDEPVDLAKHAETYANVSRDGAPVMKSDQPRGTYAPSPSASYAATFTGPPIEVVIEEHAAHELAEAHRLEEEWKAETPRPDPVADAVQTLEEADAPSDALCNQITEAIDNLDAKESDPSAQLDDQHGWQHAGEYGADS